MNKTLIFVAILFCFLFASEEVESIQYRSNKTSTIAGDSMESASVVYFGNGDVRIDFYQPIEKTLLLTGSDIYFIAGDQSQHFDWQKAPAELKATLKPSIFAAADFVDRIKSSYNFKEIAKDKKGNVSYEAKPKNEDNPISIKYEFSSEGALNYYKVYGAKGELVSEVRFTGYKTFTGKYLLPTKVYTVLNTKYGLAEETEVFSRIRVNGKIDKEKFIYSKK